VQASTLKVRTEIGRRDLNNVVLAVFAPLLIVVGVAGFFIPPAQSLTSGATPYNVFHILFGALGLLALTFQSGRFASIFNAGFGLIDLYQALASYLDLPPRQHFLWTQVDDILHLVIGLTLAIIGFYGIFKGRPFQEPSGIQGD